MMKDYNLITILGPTATGKTSIAARLAYELKTEIISADSRQIYRDMDLGTGKDLEDYSVDGKPIPYHLIDIKNAGEEYSIYEYKQDFDKAFAEIRSRNLIPILCGGSGMYLEAVTTDYNLSYVPDNIELRESLSEKSDAELIEILNEFGPVHNTTDTEERDRLIRAIEIAKYQSEEKERESHHKVNSIFFGVDTERAIVRERITRRLHERLNTGMVEEVQKLMEKGVTHEQLKWYGLEYKFISNHLAGEITYDEMVSGLNTAIHQFAKRQMTWFRRMEKKGIKIHWIKGELPLEEKFTQNLNFL